MKKTFINPNSFGKMIAIDDFKKWILKEYKHPWHTLSDTILYEALTQYNSTAKLKAEKFWD